MPIQNGNYNTFTGKDTSLRLVGPYGQVDISQVKEFTSKPSYKDFDQKLMTGHRLRSSVGDGWEGSFTFAKGSAQIDELFGQMEDDWHDRGQHYNVVIYEYEIQPDGSTLVWQYEDATIKYEDAGTKSGEKEVEQKIAFMAARRKKVG